MKKIVIFASGDVDALVRRLKIGTPDLELVAGDIVTQKIRDEIQMLYPKNIEPTIERRRVKLANDLMQDPKIIVVIDTKKSAKYLEVYKESAATYDEVRTTIALKVTNGNIADHSKELFLISGENYDLLTSIITKLAPSLSAGPIDPVISYTIQSKTTKEGEEEVVKLKTIEELEDEAITQVNRLELSLLTIDTNISDTRSRDFLERLGTRKSFAVINIEVTQEIPEEKIEEEPVINQNTVNDHAEEKSSSPINEEISSEEDLTIFQDAWWAKNFPNTIFPWTKNKEARRAVIEAKKKPIAGDPDKLAKLQEESRKIAAEKGITKQEAPKASEQSTV